MENNTNIAVVTPEAGPGHAGETPREKLTREFAELENQPIEGRYEGETIAIVFKSGAPVVMQSTTDPLNHVLCGHGPLSTYRLYNKESGGHLDVEHVDGHWDAVESFITTHVIDPKGHLHEYLTGQKRKEHVELQKGLQQAVAFYEAMKLYRERSEKQQAMMVEAGIFTMRAFSRFLETQKGEMYITTYRGQRIIGIVEEAEISRTWRGMVFEVPLVMAEVREDGTPVAGTIHVRLPVWLGLREAKDIDFRKPTEEELAVLRTRGERYLELATGPKYMNITSGFLPHPWTGEWLPMVARGRAVVDQPGSLISGVFFQNIKFLDDLDQSEHGEHICPEIMPPFLNVFSFRLDAWVGVIIDNITPIAFRENAFDNLVINDTVKDDIHLLTTSVNKGVDFVDGKAGGTIFLMDGPPGVGKTLTAETVSETLQKPLYRVNIGTLGTTPTTVETGLQNILKLAKRWEAVLLLDEADVFLEARNAADIVRNAIVCVFLRLLEYYNGVLFLTTNRGANLDPAVLSRVTYHITLDNLTPQQRLAIWGNLSTLYGDRFQSITHEGWQRIADIDLNGREIKNFLRVINAVAPKERELEAQDVVDAIARQRPDVLRRQQHATVSC